MKLKKIKLHSKKQNFELNLEVCGFFKKISGLMFKTENSRPLLFEFKKSVNMAIHSWFVFFPFAAIWLDEENKIIDSEIVGPFKFNILPEKPFRRLIEIPVNEKNREIISILVGSKTFK